MVRPLLEKVIADAPREPGSDLRFAAAVASFGMLLRKSEHCPGCTFGSVATLAEGALDRDEDGYRREFIELVRTAGAIADRTTTAAR